MQLYYLLLIILFHNQYAQSERFIVDVTYFMPPQLTPIATLCSGTMLTHWHVLTTATCVKVPLPFQVAITAHEVLYVNGLPTNNSYTITAAAWVVFFHPNFIETQDALNNVAVVIANGGIGNGNSYVPRLLGGLLSNSPCNLHGWGGDLEDHRRDSITVYGPQFCQANMPQVYCTPFDSSVDSTCTAILGSPITCGNDSIVEGFLLNNRSCSTSESRITLNYHSISDFREWIDNTTARHVPSRSSITFVVYIAEYTPPSLISGTVRCSGTIIASNRVLTTADCATVEAPLLLSIQSRGTSTSSTIHGYTVKTSFYLSTTNQKFSFQLLDTVTNILIHPNYKKEKSVANIAVLEINGSFRNGIIPRYLGSLLTNSSCQLYGWGSYLDLTRIDAVDVYGPQYCDPAEQVFCSKFTSNSHYTCSASLGSPLICEDEGIISGFLLSNGSCSSNNENYVLKYHPVSEFRNWIDNPTSDPNDAIVVKHTSILVIILSIVINLIK